MNLIVKEFRKLMCICQSYDQESSVLCFFETQSTCGMSGVKVTDRFTYNELRNRWHNYSGAAKRVEMILAFLKERTSVLEWKYMNYDVEGVRHGDRPKKTWGWGCRIRLSDSRTTQGRCSGPQKKEKYYKDSVWMSEFFSVTGSPRSSGINAIKGVVIVVVY